MQIAKTARKHIKRAQALAADPNQFVQTVTIKLMTYALGRAIDYQDMPTVRGIVRESAKQDYRFKDLVMDIVASTPFQMRRAGERDAASSDVAGNR